MMMIMRRIPKVDGILGEKNSYIMHAKFAEFLAAEFNKNSTFVQGFIAS